MIDELGLGWPALSKMRQEARLILFYKIINGLAQASKASLLKRIRALEENTIRNFDRLFIPLSSMDIRFSLKLLVHGTALLSLKFRHWLYLDQIFFKK